MAFVQPLVEEHRKVWTRRRSRIQEEAAAAKEALLKQPDYHEEPTPSPCSPASPCLLGAQNGGAQGSNSPPPRSDSRTGLDAGAEETQNGKISKECQSSEREPTLPQLCSLHYEQNWCKRGELCLSPHELDSVVAALKNSGLYPGPHSVLCNPAALKISGVQLLVVIEACDTHSVKSPFVHTHKKKRKKVSHLVSRPDNKRALSSEQQDSDAPSVCWHELGEQVFKEIIDFAADVNMLQLTLASRDMRYVVSTFHAECAPLKLCTEVGIVGLWRRFPLRVVEARLRDIAKVEILTDHLLSRQDEMQAFFELVSHVTRRAAPRGPTSFFFGLFAFSKESLWILGPHKNAQAWKMMGEELPPQKSSRVCKPDTGEEFWLELTYNSSNDQALLCVMSSKMATFRSNRRRTRDLGEILAKCLMCRGDGLETGRHYIKRHVVRELDPIHRALLSGSALPFVIAVGPSLLENQSP